MRSKYNLCLFVGVAMLLLCNVNGQTVINEFHPTSGPVSGGTVIYVTGQGFIMTGPTRSKCLFRDTSYGSLLSLENVIYNSTYLRCTMPEIYYLPSSVLVGGHYLSFSVTAGNGVQSNSASFFVFDLATMHVFSIYPSEGVNSSRTLISITGEGFLDTSEITCKVDSTDNTKINATFINGTFIQCVLLPYSTSAQVRIKIAMNGQPSSNLQPNTGNATIFTFFVTPPQIVSCKFSSSYALLFLTFDREVEIGRESEHNTTHRPDCANIFSNMTQDLIGRDANCFWYNSQQRAIVIQLTANSRVEEGSVIMLKGDNVRTRSVEYSRLASGSISISLNTEVLQPFPVLEAPGSIPYCGNFTLSAANSQHGGYRTLKYEWRIEKEIPATGDVIEDPRIVDSIPSGFTTQSTLTFPSDVFEENATYTVQLTVRNFLNITATVTVNITKLPQPAPSVTIVGSQMKHVRSDKEIRLEGMAVLPECLNASGVVDYAWAIANQMGYEVNLGNFTTRSAVLTLPPNSILPHSVHTATLAVSVRGKVGSAVAILITDLSNIRARINGGNHITVSYNDTIYLDSRVSEGLSTDITNDRLFSVSWTCMNTTELPATLPCLDQDGSPLNTSSTELVYTIPGATLQPGSYNFSLTLNYRGQQSTTYQMIVILPYHVPLVTLTPPLGLEAVPVHEKFTLRARIYSDFPGTAQWSTQPVVGYAQLELSPRVARTQLKYDILPNTEASLNETVHLLIVANATSPPLMNQITLVLERGVLLADNSYRFRIEATNTQGHTGYAEIDIHTASVPLSGSFDIQPASGSPLDTKFSLRALWWTDDIGDTPLSYQFGFHYPQERDVQWLNGLLDQNVISSVLPLPHWFNNSVNLVLQIYDNKGALARHEASVVLEYNKNDSNNSIDIIRLMKTIEHMSLVNGNWIEGLAHLTALTLSQHRYPNEFDPTELQIFKDRAINLLIELYRTYIPTSKSFLNQLLSLMFRVTYQVELTTDTVEQVLVILESVVDTYNGFGEMSVFLKPGFSEDEANLIFGTYANLITANSHGDSTRLISDNITNSLLNVVPILGYGMCKQLGVGERDVFTFAENFGSLKSSQINLPRMYNVAMTYESDPYKTNGTIYIDFTNRLFRQYLQWPCRTESESQCSGVCITSAQFRQDMRWQGSLYSSYTKTPFLHVTLANPTNGSVLQIQDLQTTPVVISFPITSDPSNLECVHWSKTLNAWSPQGCTTDITSPGVVTCACDHLSEFTVVERCPSGFFGANCVQVCPQGLWGEECLMECNCGGRGTCSPVNGACNCDPGWSGTRCETSCPAGSWGDSCAETCLCENQGQCYPVDGSCNCTPGWLGDYCNVSCPAGLFGDRCSGVCECRDISECSTITGQCNCQPGYSGITCHDECLEGFFGQNCSLECNCNLNGTVSCHHINGTCICQDQWMGVQCEFEITPQPSPTPSPTIHSPEPSFQIWWIVVPVLLIIVAVAVTILAIVLWRKIKHHKQVLPITQDKKATGGGGRTGNEVAINGDDELEITHAESYSVLIPKGSKLKDIFPKQNDEQVNFKEPPQLNGKQRWQIIQLLPEKDEREAGSRPPVELETPSPPKADKKGSKTENTASEAGLDEGQANSVSDDNETITIEVIYKRGVYLDVDATMKDLRNGFIESNQLDAKDRIFQFLKSDVPGDYIEIDTEDEVMLAQIEHNLVQPKTFYIESLDPGSVQLELCTCGKFADLECTECHSRGYCSEKCQQDDWHRHTLACQIISEKKRKKSKKARKKKRKRRKNIEGYTPSLTLCICGKETEFECSNCGLQGYCSEKCQLEDWSFHEYHCIKPPTRATPPRRGERPLMTIEEVPESEEVSTQSEFMLAATPT